MLTTLSTLKSRLALLPGDTTYDTLLTNAILAVSTRFDRETNRTLARTENATHEFDPSDTEILPPCYPIESVSKFELKYNETDGWLEQPNTQYLIRHSCIISLPVPLAFSPQPSAFPSSRLTYTAGYVLPGTTPGPGQTPLPADLEQAAVEQAAFWFQSRDHLGIRTSWPSGGEYKLFATFDPLPSVSAILSRHRRLTI